MNDSYLLLYYTFVRGFFCNICVIAFNKSVSRFETHCSVVKVCVITPLDRMMVGVSALVPSEFLLSDLLLVIWAMAPSPPC